jgi:hypothetical protein
MIGHQEHLQKYGEARKIYKMLIVNKKVLYTEVEGK